MPSGVSGPGHRAPVATPVATPVAFRDSRFPHRRRCRSNRTWEEGFAENTCRWLTSVPPTEHDVRVQTSQGGSGPPVIMSLAAANGRCSQASNTSRRPVSGRAGRALPEFWTRNGGGGSGGTNPKRGRRFAGPVDGGAQPPDRTALIRRETPSRRSSVSVARETRTWVPLSGPNTVPGTTATR